MRLYPPGFLSLSASVACERFGFFLLASLLLLYLNEQLGFTTAQATDILGCFIAATYLSPLLAGAFTDGRLGIVRVASLGYVVAATGYALLAAESRLMLYVGPVSYTHLDVYKRQSACCVASEKSVAFAGAGCRSGSWSTPSLAAAQPPFRSACAPSH